MHLNTLAGRSYNDLMQYPVFPWIILDTESDVLELNETTVRDLSKPIGALDPNAAKDAQTRFDDFFDSEIPKFHHGSHYSSAAIVLYYLCRIEPYTRLHVELQNGSFDHADRLFLSMQGTVQSILKNASDVKELIPECFMSPLCFKNVNEHDFGARQDKTIVGDVVLPPWACNDIETFIKIQKAALESSYVSERLHDWIDLIFGYKQTGKAAVDAVNVFFHLTYEHVIAKIADERDKELREAAMMQINFFGQTPSQLFREPHRRRVFRAKSGTFFEPVVVGARSKEDAEYSELNELLGICVHPKRRILLEALPFGCLMRNQFPPKDISLPWVNPPHFRWCLLVNLRKRIAVMMSGVKIAADDYVGFVVVSTDSFFKLLKFSGQEGSVAPGICSKKNRFSNVMARGSCISAKTCCTNASGNVLCTCGHWDNSIIIVSIESAKVMQQLQHHSSVVRRICLTRSGRYMVSGDDNGCLITWNVG